MCLISAFLSSCHIKPHAFAWHLCRVSSPVPFLESPKFVPKRKESSHTLPLPSLHSHPLLRANSDNTMTQSDPQALPNKAATNPNPGQVLMSIRWMCMLWSFVTFLSSVFRVPFYVWGSLWGWMCFLQGHRRASIGVRSSSSPRTRTRSPSRGRGGQSDTEERHRQPRGRQG